MSIKRLYFVEKFSKYWQFKSYDIHLDVKNCPQGQNWMTYGKTTCQIFTEDDTISLILVTQLFAEFGKVRILKFFFSMIFAVKMKVQMTFISLFLKQNSNVGKKQIIENICRRCWFWNNFNFIQITSIYFRILPALVPFVDTSKMYFNFRFEKDSRKRKGGVDVIGDRFFTLQSPITWTFIAMWLYVYDAYIVCFFNMIFHVM